MLVNNSFARRDWRLLLIDGGHWLLVLLLMGAIIGVMGSQQRSVHRHADILDQLAVLGVVVADLGGKLLGRRHEWLARACGKEPLGDFRLARTAFISLRNRSTIAAGVPTGANNACQFVTS